MNKGIFIVIDGTDGSGKATQTDLLIKRLSGAGYKVKKADFPQYGKKSAGLVEEYLNGKYGKAKEVGPYRASVFYAVDRYDASFQIKKWLNEGYLVISNRYVSSNMGHQGGKISDTAKRKAYLEWNHNLEYNIFEIPKPDLTIILHVDARVAQKLVDKKNAREYINGAKRDIHEKDLEHLRDAEKVYLEIANNFPGMRLIECTQNDEIMSIEEISELIRKELNDFFANSYQEKKKENKASQDQFLVERLSPTAKIPKRAYKHDAGYDLFADDYYTLLPGERAIVKTGIKMAIPPSCVGLIWDKGGIAKTGIHTMAGVVDAGFRGEVTVNLINLSQNIYNISSGQKIAQILIQKIKTPEIKEAKITDQTERGQGRFGSSGLE